MTNFPTLSTVLAMVNGASILLTRWKPALSPDLLARLRLDDPNLVITRSDPKGALTLAEVVEELPPVPPPHIKLEDRQYFSTNELLCMEARFVLRSLASRPDHDLFNARIGQRRLPVRYLPYGTVLRWETPP